MKAYCKDCKYYRCWGSGGDVHYMGSPGEACFKKIIRYIEISESNVRPAYKKKDITELWDFGANKNNNCRFYEESWLMKLIKRFKGLNV